MEIKSEEINKKKIEIEMNALRAGYSEFYDVPELVSGVEARATTEPINKTGFAFAVLLAINACKPAQLLKVYCAQTGTRFSGFPNTTIDPNLPTPVKGPNNGTAAVATSHLPSLGEIGNGLLTYGKYVYDSLPTWPKPRMTGVDCARLDDFNEAYWRPSNEKHKIELPYGNESTSTALSNITVESSSGSVITNTAKPSFNISDAYFLIDTGAIVSGINAYHRWPANIPQDERLKGLALERQNYKSDIYQLLDAFAPLISRTWGGDAIVDQYEYTVLQYAMQAQHPKDDNHVSAYDPAEPQAARPQAELRNEVAQLFFNALAQINGPSGDQALENFIHSSVTTELATNPTLDALSKLTVRTEAAIRKRLELHVPLLNTADRHWLNTLSKWFVEAALRAIDPLLSAQLNIDDPDFRDTTYLSYDGTLMSIGAGFINQFPPKFRSALTPAALREAGLHSLIDLSPAAWPLTTAPALIRFCNSLTKNTPNERLGSHVERMKSGLASLMTPLLPKIRLMQAVQEKGEHFSWIINDRSTENVLHKQQSKNALEELLLSKYNLYNFGLAQLPITDRNNLIRSGKVAHLEVFLPRVILYDAQHADISYKAAFTATSGLIIRTGSINDAVSSDYYLFSEERSWGAPVVSKITEQIQQAGGVTEYVNKHHASFTSGIRFPPSDHTSFEAPSIFGFATNLDEIAFVVSELQIFPAAIHKRIPQTSPSQPHPQTWTEEIFHSNIYALGKFIIGLIPEGNCVIAILDTAEMIALPAKTDEGRAEQGMAIGTDALFCFTGLIKINEAQYLIPSVRAAFNYGSADEFATSQVEKHLSEQMPKTGPVADLADEKIKPGERAHVATKPEDLHFRTGISEFFDTAPVIVEALPNKISVQGNTLNVPHNLSPKGLIQKSDGGPIYLVMALDHSGKRVSYLWNESEEKLELQTEQWLQGYGHLIDEDPQILWMFIKNFPKRVSSAGIAEMLYDNKRLNGVRKVEYQSFFDHTPEQVERGVYSIGDREYIQLKGEFYLLEKEIKADGERRIMGEGIPKDLRLDMKYDGVNWHVTNNHLITPVTSLPETIVSFNEALEQGFNLPEGWSTSTMYIDNSNPDQFVLSFQDKSGKTQYRYGPDRKNAFEELSAGEFEEKQCRARRAPPEGPKASCSALNFNIAPLPRESARTKAINQLVAMDVETRPYYERPLLRLEMSRDVEKIRKLFHNNPHITQLFFILTTRMNKGEKLMSPRVINEMKTFKWGGDGIPKDRLLSLTNFWDEMKLRLAREPNDDFGGQAAVLQDICESSLRLCNNQRTFSELKDIYNTKVNTLNQLSDEYEINYVKPQQRITTRLWKRVFGPPLTSEVTRAAGWTFEIRAKGLSEIRHTFGPYFADDISAAYANSHELTGQLLDWSKIAPESFWEQVAAYFHVAPEKITSGYKDEIIRILSKFKGYAAPVRIDKLRIISPLVSPEGIRYRYNMQKHIEGIPQETALFADEVLAYTHENGLKRGELYLTTTTFLSPINHPTALQETLQHEISHLAIPDGKQEIYLTGDRSKYGYCSENGLRRQADVLLSSPAAFLRYVKGLSHAKRSFLRHFQKVLPSSFSQYLPEGVNTHISHERFRGFIKKVFEGPADEKIKAFMMPDLFVAWLQHMSKALPKTGAEQAELRHKRDASPDDMNARVTKLLVRELFETSSDTTP
ncbi:hypothetical protein ACXX82_03640 [Glaciimonas sp. GNP009]